MVWDSRREGKHAALPQARTAAAVICALLLASCSSTFSSLPSQVGGEPAGTPERPVTPAAYPAVHDMPPARTSAVLTDAQRKQAEDELAAIRDRQNKRAGTSSNSE